MVPCSLKDDGALTGGAPRRPGVGEYEPPDRKARDLVADQSDTAQDLAYNGEVASRRIRRLVSLTGVTVLGLSSMMHHLLGLPLRLSGINRRPASTIYMAPSSTATEIG